VSYLCTYAHALSLFLTHTHINTHTHTHHTHTHTSEVRHEDIQGSGRLLSRLESSTVTNAAHQVLQRVVEYCGVLRCAAVCCCVLPCVAVFSGVLQHDDEDS